MNETANIQLFRQPSTVDVPQKLVERSRELLAPGHLDRAASSSEDDGS